MNELINKCILEILDLLTISYKYDMILYGENGVLDSISLIHLITKIEESFLINYSISLTLVDNKIFSPKNSPFKNESSIIIFVEELIKNE
jgi:hypothetical protein